jgi:hypothetical protein
MRQSLIFAALAVGMMSTAANAAIKYEFTALSTDSSLSFNSVSGSFTYTAPDFIASDTTVPAADLSSCSASDSVLGALGCGDQSFLVDFVPGHAIVEFGVTGPSDRGFFFYFDPSVFSTIGAYSTNGGAPGQDGRLVVSEVTGVPETPTWGLLALGFGGLAVAMSLRPRALLAG